MSKLPIDNCHSERVYPEKRSSLAIEDEASSAPESDAIIEQNVSSGAELTDE